MKEISDMQAFLESMKEQGSSTEAFEAMIKNHIANVMSGLSEEDREFYNKWREFNKLNLKKGEGVMSLIYGTLNQFPGTRQLQFFEAMLEADLEKEFIETYLKKLRDNITAALKDKDAALGD